MEDYIEVERKVTSSILFEGYIVYARFVGLFELLKNNLLVFRKLGNKRVESQITIARIQQN